MEETESQDFKKFIADRLMKQTSDVIFDGREVLENESVRDSETLAQPVAAPELKVATTPLAKSDDEASAFAKVDKSLISLGFFTPSSRRIKNQKIKSIRFTRNEAGKKVEASVEFHPSPVYGLPITADQDKFLALHHIITKLLRDNGSVVNPIRFTSADMLRLLDKKRQSGKNYKEIAEWLACMTTTSIISKGVVYKAGEKRYAQDVFHVFDRATSVGKEMPDGSIADANYVWLSTWQLDNINEKYLLPIDVLTYRKVRNHIAKALIPLLQVWLFASQRAGSFEKRYDELCEMLGLQIFKAPSRITQQLKSSFDELVTFEYLEKWRIERTVDKRQFKIIFFHGAKFHRDQNRRLQDKAAAEEMVVVAESGLKPDIPEPGRLDVENPGMEQSGKRGKRRSVTPVDAAQPDDVGVDLAPESLHVQESEPLDSRVPSLADELSARGVMPTTAMRLLESLPAQQLDGVGDYIDYWDETRKAKEVGPGLLYGLIRDLSPLPSNFVTRRQREARQTTERRERDLSRLKDAMDVAYEEYCERSVERFIAEGLPPGEFEKRVEFRRNELAQEGGLWDGTNNPQMAKQMAQLQVRAAISNDIVVSYDEFSSRQLPQMLEKLELDPVGLGLYILDPDA